MHRVLTLAAIAATLIVAGCGGSNSNSGETPASAAMSDTVGVKQIDGIGKVLVDTSGMALYTPDQEAKWTSVAQAMRDNASRMEKLVAEKRKIPPEKTTAVDDLKTYQEFTEVRLDGLKHLTSAFKSLYDSMTPDQKKNADTVFEKYTPPRPANQG